MSIIHVSLTKDVLSLIPCQVDQLHVFAQKEQYLIILENVPKVN